MAKKTGMGSSLWVDEYDISGDTQQINSMSANMGLLDITGINSSAVERITGLQSGAVDFSVFFNDASNAAHDALSPLPTTDTIVSFGQGSSVGDAALSIVAKQVGYDPTRGADGSLTFDVSAQSNHATYGYLWGLLGTPGLDAATTTESQSSIDHGASSSNGLYAFLHVTAFSGTNATIAVMESSDNGASDAFEAVATFTSVTGVGAEAINVSGSVERYLRAEVTVDNFTSMTYGVVIARIP